MTNLIMKRLFPFWSFLLAKTISPKTNISIAAITLILLGFLPNYGIAQITWDGSENDNWGEADNWTPASVPTASDAVIINSGATVNVNVAAVCSSITMNGGSNSDISLVVPTGQSLVVGGAININAPSQPVAHTLSVDGGTLSCSSLTMANITNNNRDAILDISAGTVTISGNLTMNGALNRNIVVFSGAGTLNVGGVFNNLGTFTAGSGTVNYNGSGVQAVRSASYNNLTLSGGGEKTLSGSASVSGTLTLNDGNLVTTTGILLTLTDGASVSGGSKDSFIDGPLAKTGSTDFGFPVGDDGIFAPLGISSLGGSSTFTAEYFRTAPSNPTALEAGIDHISGIEFWDIDGGTSASITLSWRASSSVTDLPSLRVVHFDATSTWANEGNVAALGSAAGGTITSESINSFSPCTLGSVLGGASNPLPVELLSFTADKKSKGVLLEWETATEVNNAFFQVERSLNGKEFDVISKVEGVGNSDITQSYQLLDESPRSGINYYRLKQVDFDGAFEYHPIVSVDMGPTKEASLQLFPNPAIDKVTANLPSEVEGEADLVIYNALGQLVKTIAIDLVKGNNNTALDLQDLAKGRYTLVVNYGGQRLTQAPLMIQK